MMHCSSRHPGSTLLFTAIGLTGLACSQPQVPESAAAAPILPFSDIFEVLDSIRLEENDTALLVAPFLDMDPAGGYLVADAEEAQVRRYSADGDLLHVFGRKGRGPGELIAPISVVRMNHEIWIFDLANGVVRYDADSNEPIDGLPPPVSIVYDVQVLEDGRLLIAGLGGASREHLIHFWSPRTSEFRSFVDTKDHLAPRGVKQSFNWAAASVRDGLIAVVVGLSDSLFIMDMMGVRQSAFQLPIPHFYEALLNLDPALLRDPLERAEWSSRLKRPQAVVWLPSGQFVVQYMTVHEHQTEWSVIVMDRDGTPIATATGTPRLLTSTGDTLIFQAAPDLEPNKLLMVNLRKLRPP